MTASTARAIKSILRNHVRILNLSATFPDSDEIRRLFRWLRPLRARIEATSQITSSRMWLMSAPRGIWSSFAEGRGAGASWMHHGTGRSPGAVEARSKPHMDEGVGNPQQRASFSRTSPLSGDQRDPCDRASGIQYWWSNGCSRSIRSGGVPSRHCPRPRRTGPQHEATRENSASRAAGSDDDPQGGTTHQDDRILIGQQR